MDAIYEAVQRMQDYIEAHLREEITLAQLARAAGYSQWHAAKLFRDITGKTPFDYLRARRLSAAALRLRDTQSRVIDVALDFTFDSHEGFTRAFSRQFGLSPRRYGKEVPPIPLFIPSGVLDYRRHTNRKEDGLMTESPDKKTRTIFVQVVERPESRLLLKRGTHAEDYFAYCEEVGCDVWGVLTSVKDALYEPAGYWLPKALIAPGTSKYVQGVALPMGASMAVPEGFDLITLPASTMMVFQGEPYEDEQFEEAIGEAWEAIDNYDPTLHGFEWDAEAAPRFQLAPMGYRGYIEARPVKAIRMRTGG